MINTILSLAGSALSLWQSKEKRKYQDKLMKLERRWHEENNKLTDEEDKRDFNVLDHIERDIELLGNAIVNDIKGKA